MPNWAGSSWYYLRYMDPHNDEEFVSKEAEEYWGPVDWYNGGMEHTTLHLLYSRFWHMFLYDIGVVHTPEPYAKRTSHGMILGEGGEKMSKSRGNVIYADDLIRLFGVDAVRYYVLHEMPYDNDGTITWELMTERYNSDLANILGNLVNRTISMSNKYFDGFVSSTGVTGDTDEDLKAVCTQAAAKVKEKMDQMRMADALTEVFNVFRRCNKYIDETSPWVLAKDEENKARLSEVMYNLVEGICIGANLLKPFMPDTADKILMMLYGTERDFEYLSEFGIYRSGTKVTDEPQVLFARLKVEDIMEEVSKIQAAQRAEYEKENGITKEDKEDEGIHVELKDEIEYEDFAKMQFVVGEIIACEEVPKSKKLLCSKVKVGDSVKQIVSGIKAYYKPEEMVGKKVMVLLNLKPATLAGVVSEGMLLCAEDSEGNLALMKPEKDMESGAEIC
jgi:methionyl-tRNA synthetase